MTTCGRCLTLPIVVDRILPSQTQRTATHPEGRGLCPGAPPTSPEGRQLRPSGAREHGIKDNKHAGDRQPSVTAAYVDLPHNCSQLLISQSDSWARLLSSLVDEVMDGRETIARDSVSRTHCQRCCICGNIQSCIAIFQVVRKVRTISQYFCWTFWTTSFRQKNNVTTNDKVYSKIMLWNAFIAGTLLIVLKIRRAKSQGKEAKKRIPIQTTLLK